MDDTLRHKIIKDLANYRSRDDILRELCFTYGYKWDEAVAIVDAVEAEEQDSIVARKRPLVMGVNLAMAIGGLAIMVAMLLLALSGVSISLQSIPIPYLGNIVFGIGGLVLLIRGIVGLYDSLRATQFS